MATKTLKTNDGVLIFGKSGYPHFTSNSFKLQSYNQRIQTIYCGNQYLIYGDKYNLPHCFQSTYKQNHSVLSTVIPFITEEHINFFTNQKISVKQIFTDFAHKTIFWITNDKNVYANGPNQYGQLGIDTCDDSVSKPSLVKDLLDMDIIDIQFGNTFSIALCCSNRKDAMMILNYWCRNEKIQLMSTDIIKLMATYYACTDVYGTCYSLFGGNGHSINDQTHKIKRWKKIETFNDVNIVKIASGQCHSVFLDSDGVLWVCGHDMFGYCGIGDRFSIYLPIKMEYFVNNGIKIIDVKCGWYHSLVLSENGKVYSWGKNNHFQCGLTDSVRKIPTPKLVNFPGNDMICEIDCGGRHSYCKTSNGKHYLFGSNKQNECIVEGENSVSVPFCINQIIEEKTNGKIIKAVSLGDESTTLIVGT
eukprot:405939_1